jgi:hypothetical protein
MAPIFQPISGIISDPVERAGLGLEAGNVFLLPIWIGAYDMPLNPKLAGKWSEREFAYGLGHLGNMRRIPEGGHPRPRSALIQTAPLSGIRSELEAMEGVGG